MHSKTVDILIVGGGLIGATLLLALKDSGYSALLVENKTFSDKIKPDFDARTLALSPASIRILTMLGLWEIISEYATPINMIHVSEQRRFGISRITAKNNNPLGYVVEMQYMYRALNQLIPIDQLLAPAILTSLDVSQCSATINTQEGEQQISAQLIVAADGTHSTVRRFSDLKSEIKKYNQHALVANIALSKSHENKAYERFTAHGPLALLPMSDNKMAMVWAMPPEQAQKFMNKSEADFLKELQTTFGYRCGRFVKAGTRNSYPLSQMRMNKQTQWPLVFVGNAAHTLHPVAGQGFNLGLRDVATLAQCITQYGLDKAMLDTYEDLRRHDQKIITQCTDGLVNLFTSRIPGLGLARSIGLITLDNIPLLKNLLGRYARGFGGVVPDLVCEMALNRGHNESRL